MMVAKKKDKNTASTFFLFLFSTLKFFFSFDSTLMILPFNKQSNSFPVKCCKCQSFVTNHQPSSHVCSLVDSVSQYNEITKSTTDYRRLDLQDILALRKKSRCHSYSRCCRCFHGNATISIAKKLYHTQCLSCFYCRLSLMDNEIKVFEGQVFCAQHYIMVKNRPICATCKKPIESTTRPTIAFNHHYFHPEHLRCHYCHKPVDPITTGLQERKGKVYCQTDYNRLFLPICVSCHRAVQKEAVVSTDGKLKGSWHTYCFKCQMCGLPLLSADKKQCQFYVYKNAPYCRLDYHKLNKSLCQVCFLPVEGHCAQAANGQRFHPDCFFACNKNTNI
ncbi:MAG: hypothetical protein EXX96DRAFT_232722 [Benjaminiella poitrasii]|nr:MAG: hypothetical protein EXX96DRAFT_232722 [Benjaminiella poitrasii]